MLGAGVGHPFLKFVAELGVVAAHTMLVLMLTLIAQGWTILRSEVQYRNLLLAMVASLGGFSFLLLWWGAFPASAATEAADGFGAFVWRDPTSFTYLYDTSPGVVLLCAPLLLQPSLTPHLIFIKLDLFSPCSLSSCGILLSLARRG